MTFPRRWYTDNREWPAMFEMRIQIQRIVMMIDFPSSKRRVYFRDGLGVLIWTRIEKKRRRARRGPALCTLIGLSVVRIKRGEIGVHQAEDRWYLGVK
jgi:hypothetical protein